MEHWLKNGFLKRKVADDQNPTKYKVLNLQVSSSNDSYLQDKEETILTMSDSEDENLVQQKENNKTANIKKKTITRKYNTEFLKIGFTYAGDIESPRPQCVLCYEILSNECLKFSKIKRHFESKHKDYIGKPPSFFQNKANELNQNKNTMHYMGGQKNVNATEASYRVSLLIAKCMKDHTVAENLIKPAAKIMAKIMLGEKAESSIEKISLSNNTVKRRITCMADDVKKQLMSRIQKSMYFSIQIDETTDLVNEAHLLTYVRYEYCGSVHDDFLFCQTLPGKTTGEEIFRVLNSFIVENEIDWTRCVGLCTDGAAAMTGKMKGLSARVKSVAPLVKITHCCIHREQLAAKKIPKGLKSVMDEAVKIINFIKSRALNARLFKILCEEMGSDHTQLLFHTEVRWLSRGKVLTRFFELRDEIKLFLKDEKSSSQFINYLQDPNWLVQLAYLADMFGYLNGLNLQLQGKNTTIFNVQDKIKALTFKCELWQKRLENKDLESFATLNEYVTTTGITIPEEIVQDFKKHMRELGSQLNKYFPEKETEFQWIRNPFQNIEYINNIENSLSSKEVDCLVELTSDSSLKTIFHEKNLIDFWFHVNSEYPELSNVAIKYLFPFCTTYNCEVGFSIFINLKTKNRNRLDVNSDMRLKLSCLEPDISSLITERKQYHSSH